MALNTVKPPSSKPRANRPREVAPPTSEAVTTSVVPEPEPVEEEEAPRGPRSTWSVFTMLDRVARMDGLFREGLPVRFLPHVLFIMFLTLVYIGNTHYANRMNRSIQKIKLEIEDLRADKTTLQSDYMEASKQSEVARKVAPYGLVESSSPPFRINVPAGRLDEASLDLVPLLTADSIAARTAAASAAAAAAAAADLDAPVQEAAPPGPVAGGLPDEAAEPPAAGGRAERAATPSSSTRSAARSHEKKR